MTSLAEADAKHLPPTEQVLLRTPDKSPSRMVSSPQPPPQTTSPPAAVAAAVAAADGAAVAGCS
jgi:hypothetical protein